MRALAVLALVVLASGCTLLEAPGKPSPIVTNVTSTTTTTAAAGAAPCATLAISLDRAVLRPGENVTINVTLANCGNTFLPVSGDARCSAGTSLALDLVDARDAHYQLFLGQLNGTPTQMASLSYGPCMSDAAPARVLVAPGTSTTDAYSWNGTVERAAEEYVAGSDGMMSGFRIGDIEESPLAGDIQIASEYHYGNDSTAAAGAKLTLDFPPRTTTRAIVVREWDWMNGTAEANGSRAMPRRDEATLTANGIVAQNATIDDYGVLRAFANGTTAFLSWGPMGGWLASPWNASESVLVIVPAPGGSAYVYTPDASDIGMVVHVGEERAFRSISTGAEHVLVVRNVGTVTARAANATAG